MLLQILSVDIESGVAVSVQKGIAIAGAAVQNHGRRPRAWQRALYRARIRADGTLLSPIPKAESTGYVMTTTKVGQTKEGHVTTKTRLTTTALGCATMMLLGAAPALATDGVLEINQASALEGGVSAGDAPGFPATLDASGSYRLTSDLVLPSIIGVHGIDITDGPVQLDLNGFSIRGAGVCAGYPPSCSGSFFGVGVTVSTSQPVRISNGTLTGLGTAVNVLATTGTDTRSVVLEDLSIEANSGTAVFMSGSGSSVIRNCQVSRNGLLGVDIDVGHPILIVGTTFRSNGSSAIDSQGSASLVRDSFFVGNGTGIRSFFISSPSAALVYGGNSFFANTTDVVGGTQLGPNRCTSGPCP